MKIMKDSVPETWQEKLYETKQGQERIYHTEDLHHYLQAFNAVMTRNFLQEDLFIITRCQKSFSVRCIVKSNHEEYLKKVKELSAYMDLREKGVPTNDFNFKKPNKENMENYLLSEDAFLDMFDFVFKNIKGILPQEELVLKMQPLINATLYFAQIKTK